MNKEDKKQIISYQAEDGQFSLDVNVQEDSVWLTQVQMAELFVKSVPTINEHIKNCFKEGELVEHSTIRKFRIVRLEGRRSVKRDIDHYNLDVIISVGYRVKSKRGTQFRIWANKILREYLLKGYVLNTQKLQHQTAKIKELESAVQVLTGVLENRSLTQSEAVGLLKVITDYTYALDLLDQYDHQQLEILETNSNEVFKITYKEAISAINELEKQFSEVVDETSLFGNEKDDSFKGSLYNIYQTFDGHELYPSIEEKAAHLLYFVIKNHSFSDGNKRIAAFLFIWFLERNKYLYAEDGRKRIEDNALVAICLMVAESKPEEKDTIVKLIVNLINRRN